MGTILHGAQISSLPALRKFVRALTQDRLSDMKTLVDIIMTSADRSDELLEFYTSNWWGTFRVGNNNEPPVHSVENTIECWKNQRRNLIPFARPKVSSIVNLAAMSRDDLQEASSSASDCVSFLELESDRCLRHLSQVGKCIAILKAMEKDLASLQKKYTEERGTQEKERATEQSSTTE
jgi:hypothetical protein